METEHKLFIDRYCIPYVHDLGMVRPNYLFTVILYNFYQDPTFRCTLPEDPINNIITAWRALVAHQFRDAEYKSLWSTLYHCTATIAICREHQTSLWG